MTATTVVENEGATPHSDQPQNATIDSTTIDEASPRTGESAADTQADTAGPKWLRRIGFAVVNLILIFHCFAIAAGPSSIPPSSNLQRNSFLVAGPYLESLYLNHGWHYFAPDPGPSTLLEYSGVDANGQEIRGRMPDKALQKPRLLYHRHFMLTEAMPQMIDAEPEIREAYYQALANGVGRMTGAESLTLTRVVHEVPTMQSVRAGFPLDDEPLYQYEPLGSYACQR